MKDKKDIIDLVQGSDGSYEVKERGLVKAKPIKKNYPVPKQPKQQKRNENVESFFQGMDLGLDFLEGVSKRVTRIMKLRKD